MWSCTTRVQVTRCNSKTTNLLAVALIAHTADDVVRLLLDASSTQSIALFGTESYASSTHLCKQAAIYS